MSEHIADHIEAVFFDLDDTLVGTMEPKWRQHKYVAKTYYNKELSDEEIKQHWGKPLQEMICLLYSTDNAEEAMERCVAHHKDYPKELFTASVPTLQHLKAADMILGIVTATSRWSFENDLGLHNVSLDLFDYTQTADDSDYHKPDPRVFEPAVAWLAGRSIQPDNVLYIGDGLHDMKAAAGAGFNFLGVETGLVTAEHFKDAGAKSLPSIAKLLDL